MRIPEYYGAFKRDRKLLKKQHKDMSKLDEIMGLLLNEKPLLPKHENHPLHGNYKNWWECHIEPDWLLIYRIEKETNKVIFFRTGSHS
ncbi:MAG: type II toxin-antitoxin system YafQ family toxin, partial [Treponema sp.]|nr:type II toxin-antitoxin system YafQ family toxin [Treponema sp.]